MSPEQANGEPVDGRSDLFSLGSVLYTLCTGHAPLRASTTMAVLKRVCEDTARPPGEVNPDIPEWLSSIIARLHEKDPGKHYQTAAEVAELLGRAHLQPLGPVGLAANVPDQQTPRWKWRPRIALLVLLLLGTVVLGAGITAFRFFPRRGKTRTPDGAHGPVQEGLSWKPKPPLTPEELANLALSALKQRWTCRSTRGRKCWPLSANPRISASTRSIPEAGCRRPMMAAFSRYGVYPYSSL